MPTVLAKHEVLLQCFLHQTWCLLNEWYLVFSLSQFCSKMWKSSPLIKKELSKNSSSNPRCTEAFGSPLKRNKCSMTDLLDEGRNDDHFTMKSVHCYSSWSQKKVYNVTANLGWTLTFWPLSAVYMPSFLVVPFRQYIYYQFDFHITSQLSKTYATRK